MRSGWGRRRWIVAGAAGVVVVAVVAAIVGAVRASAGPDTLADVGGPVAAARARDRVPSGPVLRDVPYDCGMPPGLLKRLVGEAGKREEQEPGEDTCTWGDDLAARSGVGATHTLEIKVSMKSRDDGTPDPAEAVEQVDWYVAWSRDATGDDRAGPVTMMSGPGDLAVAWTEVHQAGTTDVTDHGDDDVWHGTAGTTVAFQTGNVAVRVTYGGADYEKKGLDTSAHPLEPDTLKGARLAAARVARAVGAPVHGTPQAVAPPDGTPIRKLPAACELVPAGTVRTSADTPDLRPEREYSDLFLGNPAGRGQGVGGDGCSWSGARHSVDLQWMRVGGDASPSTEPIVAGEYLRRYRDARDTPSGVPDAAIFTPLRGPGDRAFAHYTKDDILDGGSGIVVVRVRNALIRVRCWDIDRYPPGEALNCAYTIARAAAKKAAA